MAARRQSETAEKRRRGAEPAAFLRISHPSGKLADRLLEPEAARRLRQIVKEQRRMAGRASGGLNPRRRLLLIGARGRDRAQAVAALAGELGLPLYTLHMDVLLHQPEETAATLQEAIAALGFAPGIYFLDEYDWIGGPQVPREAQTVRRQFADFLLRVELARCLIVAATSRRHLLDYQYFRRFDEVIDVAPPAARQAVAIQ